MREFLHKLNTATATLFVLQLFTIGLILTKQAPAQSIVSPMGPRGEKGEAGESIAGQNALSYIITRQEHTVEKRTVIEPAPLPIIPSAESAYQTWLKSGNEGTEEEFLASLKGSSARTLELRWNPETLSFEQKYEDDTDWSVVLALCTVIHCEEKDG